MVLYILFAEKVCGEGKNVVKVRKHLVEEVTEWMLMLYDEYVKKVKKNGNSGKSRT